MFLIELTKTEQTKNPNTKTTYNTNNVIKELIDEKQYNNITSNDTLKWFRRLGGTETVQRCYTSAGYKVYKLTSTSPNRQQKNIREFEYRYLDYKQSELFNKLFKEYKNGLFYLKRFKRGLNFKELEQYLNKKLDKK